MATVMTLLGRTTYEPPLIPSASLDDNPGYPSNRYAQNTIDNQNEDGGKSSMSIQPPESSSVATKIATSSMNSSLLTTTSCDHGLRSFCRQYIVKNPTFQNVVFVLIVVNSLLTALQTFEIVQESPIWQNRLDALDTVFLTIFTSELALHLYYYGLCRFLTKGWLVFDVLIITLSWTCNALTVFRSFRVLRAVRVVARVKEIQELIEALLKVIPRMFAISGLLVLIYFVFAVLFTELFQTAYEDGVTSEDYFSRLDKTSFTLLQFMFLDDWSRITKELMVAYPWAWIPVLAFIIICTFIVVNLIVAVICNAVQNIQTDEMTSQMAALQSSTKSAIATAHKSDRNEREVLEEKLDQILELLRQQQQSEILSPPPSRASLERRA